MDTKEFEKEYKELCEKHKMCLVVKPLFVPRDDGTWSLKLVANIETIRFKTEDQSTSE